MESYRRTGLQQGGLPHAYTQPGRAPRTAAGSYGLSIRVQGIDGHPYVVLNNQDRGVSNGNGETEESFIDNYHEYDFRGGKEGGAGGPFKEFRSRSQTPHSDPQPAAADPPGRKPPSLLNFQKHPEILQPYDPEYNSLGLDGPQGRPARPHSLSGPGGRREGPPTKPPSPVGPHAPSTSPAPDAVPAPQNPAAPSNPGGPPPAARPPGAPSHSRAKPLGSSQSRSSSTPRVPSPPSHPAPQAPVQGPGGPDPSRPPRALSSAESTLERGRPRPDVLPLRRTDSSGPVLEASSRSRTSSSSSSSTAPGPRGPPPDDPMEALYSDTINRHQNRRYIPFLPGSGRDIDRGSIPGVDELIEKFDGKDGGPPRRGRAGRRNRLNPEDRKRSRSVDSAMPFAPQDGSEYLERFGQQRGSSMEHVLRPSQLRRSAGSQDSWVSVVDGKPGSRPPSYGHSTPTSPRNSVSKGSGSIQGYTRPPGRSSSALSLKSDEHGDGSSSLGKGSPNGTVAPSKASSSAGAQPAAGAAVQVTPDLLKGQQEISQQTHEETAKQILYNYLKDGCSDTDDTTKRKVNLVFEKIQTLKSRASGGVQVDNHQPSVDMAAQTRSLQEQKERLEKEMLDAKQKLAEQSKKSRLDSEKMGSGLKELQQSHEERSRLNTKLTKTEADLQTTLEELFQVKMEREKYQSEIRDLQDQLSEMHDELDSAKKSAAADEEKDALMTDLMVLRAELQELLLAREELEEMLRRRERELTALKGALKEEVASHDQEVDKLREQNQKEIGRLQTSLEEVQQGHAAAVREKAQLEAARGAAEDKAGGLSLDAERSHARALELETQVGRLTRVVEEARQQETRLGDRVVRLERDKKHLEESVAEVKEQEEEMSRANRALSTRFDDVQRTLSKLSLEHRELEERLAEERLQKEQFKTTKNQIEDERRLLDRTVEKLQKEMNEIVDASQSSTQELQEQIDVYKEKNRRELAELQRQLRERALELDRSQGAARGLQEELTRRVEELQQCQGERDEALLLQSALQRSVEDLQSASQTSAHTKDERARHLKLMEERIVQLEQDLDEERQSGDQLMDRIDRGRDQVEQMRGELLQERSSRQDLECDKMALERQNKDLRGRVSHLEGSQRTSQEGVVSQLEGRVGELEERLEAEERERANLQQTNRRLERKLKEMVMSVDEEHHGLQDQRDQLNLRLKALKRQMDGAEEEMDRLEHGKKKLQRELDEQQEANEQLQSQLKTLRSEMRRKTTSAPLLTAMDDDDDDDDDVSTDGETYFSSSSVYKRSSSQDNIMSTFAL
ncbi:cingulin-like protein 1 isoform X1 [Gadus macrocephalus]|uniref:cingulin-like protein 1 isoform X1 n=1 Tax=Gadus macrocephalus TaxID=80720 RepID=UPI0028CB51A0|nr:cingulin-like protein 1 isoform X1 [Gadus macrocephalus]